MKKIILLLLSFAITHDIQASLKYSSIEKEKSVTATHEHPQFENRDKLQAYLQSRGISTDDNATNIVISQSNNGAEPIIVIQQNVTQENCCQTGIKCIGNIVGNVVCCPIILAAGACYCTIGLVGMSLLPCLATKFFCDLRKNGHSCSESCSMCCEGWCHVYCCPIPSQD